MHTKILGFMLGLVLAPSALAEDVEGVVRLVGSAIEQRTILAEAAGGNGPTVCRGDVQKRIGRLTGMTVRVSGEWQLGKDGAKKCVDASAFTVKKLSNGREAVVGTLAEKGGVFQVTADDGNMKALAEVPDGLKKLSGKKVILDLKTVDSPTAKEPTSKVVSYAELP